jgi:hypothetical protein
LAFVNNANAGSETIRVGVFGAGPAPEAAALCDHLLGGRRRPRIWTETTDVVLTSREVPPRDSETQRFLQDQHEGFVRLRRAYESDDGALGVDIAYDATLVVPYVLGYFVPSYYQARAMLRHLDGGSNGASLAKTGSPTVEFHLFDLYEDSWQIVRDPLVAKFCQTENENHVTVDSYRFDLLNGIVSPTIAEVIDRLDVAIFQNCINEVAGRTDAVSALHDLIATRLRSTIVLFSERRDDLCGTFLRGIQEHREPVTGIQNVDVEIEDWGSPPDLRLDEHLFSLNTDTHRLRRKKVFSQVMRLDPCERHN